MSQSRELPSLKQLGANPGKLTPGAPLQPGPPVAPEDLGAAMGDFLKEQDPLPPAAVPPADDLAAELTATPPPMPAEAIDPLHPGAEVWEALEQEVQEEEAERVRQARLHHPQPPEELPDISNL